MNEHYVFTPDKSLETMITNGILKASKIERKRAAKNNLIVYGAVIGVPLVLKGGKWVYTKIKDHKKNKTE